MKNIRQYIKISAIPCLLGILMLCWAMPLQAVEHPFTEHNEIIGQAQQKPKYTEYNDKNETHDPSQTHETPEHGDGHKSSAQPHDSSHADSHHAPTPFIYYVYWGLLGIAFIMACFYCLRVYKNGKPKNEGLSLAFLFVLIVIVLYSINQFPEVQRHFNPASHQFVDGYHESPGMGFIKFVYKMALGICLMIYGLIGREDHH